MNMSDCINMVWPVSERLMTILGYHMREVAMRRGDLIFGEEEKTDWLWFCVSGVFRIFTTSHTKKITVAFGSEGDPIPTLVTYYNGAPSLFGVEVISAQARFCRLPMEVFNKLRRTNPEMTEWAYKLVCGQGMALEEHMVQHGDGDAYSRYLHFATTRPKLVKRLPLQYVAEYLNMSRETLSRCRRRFAFDKENTGRSRKSNIAISE